MLPNISEHECYCNRLRLSLHFTTLDLYRDVRVPTCLSRPNAMGIRGE